MNDGWAEWGLRVPDPRMINLRHAAPARPAGDLFPAPAPDGDILTNPPGSGGEPGRFARNDHVATLRAGAAAPEARPADLGRSQRERGTAADRLAGRVGGHLRGVPHDRQRHERALERAHDHPVGTVCERPRPGRIRYEEDGVMDGPGMKISTAGDIVRPFLTTAGRARPLEERLRMETLLSATPAALTAPLAFEHAHIVELCRHPLSVAEIATGLRLPVGVARLLIADLVTEHLLVIHAQVVPGARPPRELLERIRAGVRAL